MKKSVWVSIAAVVVLVGVIAGVWLVISNSNAHSTSPSSSSSQSAQPVTNAVDMSTAEAVDVTMRDLSYSPAHLKIKKGTKVTWTNQDTVGHNVVADDASNSGGLPTSHATFGRGQTFSMTFNSVGTYGYHCTPHPFMKGSIEVVE